LARVAWAAGSATGAEAVEKLSALVSVPPMAPPASVEPSVDDA
jgi:hypothetical protein